DEYVKSGGKTVIQIKNNVSVRMAIALLTAVFLLGGCQSTASEEIKQTASSEENTNLIDNKPEVAEIEPNNEPNRMITTFNGDTQTEMGFNWYTTDLFEDAKVWISSSEDMSDAIEFDAE